MLRWLLAGDEDEETPHDGLRGMIWVAIFWAMAIIALLGSCSIARADHQYGAACNYNARTWSPRPVWIDPRLDSAPWQLALARWNVFNSSVGGPEFIQVFDSNAAPTWIVPSTATWVWMNCGGVESVIYVAPNFGTHYPDGEVATAEHELVHVWAFADHITWSYEPAASRWTNPKYCDGPYASPYRGVASYCSRRSEWFGPDDRTMIRRWWGY